MSQTSNASPRLVATDLDGTLLTSSGTVSPRTKAAIARLDELSIPLVVVTGRPVRWMDQLWAEIGGHTLAVLSNGAVVYDVAGGAIRTTLPLDRSVLVEVVRRLRADLPGTSFAVEKAGGIGIEAAFRSRLDNSSQTDTTPIDVGPMEELLDNRVVKMLAQHEGIEPEEYWVAVEASIGDLVTTTWSSAHAMVEISSLGVTKASTLAALIADLGIQPCEVLAFGDMPNDIDMLRWAGTSYAMGNAHHTAQAAADYIAPSNDEDGVATVLERHFGRAGD